MKRTLLILLVAIMSVSVFAASSSFTGTGSSTGNDPVVNLSLSLSNTTSVIIGFSSSANHDATGDVYTEASPLELTVSGSTASNSESALYIWWDITSTKGYTLKLSATSLKIGEGGTDATEIDFTVAGTASSGGGDSAISIDTASSTESEFLKVESDASGTINSSSGHQQLTITTESLDGKSTSDKFTATLTASITVS